MKVFIEVLGEGPEAQFCDTVDEAGQGVGPKDVEWHEHPLGRPVNSHLRMLGPFYTQEDIDSLKAQLDAACATVSDLTRFD